MVYEADQEAEWWSVQDVAAYAKITHRSVRVYLNRGLISSPDKYDGKVPQWRPRTIIDWQAGRAKPGTGGRPASTKPSKTTNETRLRARVVDLESVLAIRERELRNALGPCKTGWCRLHDLHKGGHEPQAFQQGQIADEGD